MSVPDQENHAPIRLCDFCNESKALLYCRADSAKLGLNCDREVHSTNQLFRKHSRFLLCNSCNSSPSSIFCCTESAVLCENCDWETHKNFCSIHDRRPIEGLSGCPSVSELLKYLGLEDLSQKSLILGGGGKDDEEFLDFLVWETPSIVCLDDLIAANDSVESGRSFRAMGVPPLPKNRNAACGKHKEEIFFQLCGLAKKDPNFSGSLQDLELHVGLQSQALHGKWRFMGNNPGFEEKAEQPISLPSYETNTPNWSRHTGGVPEESFPSDLISSFVDTKHLLPGKGSDTGENTSTANGFQGVQSNGHFDFKASRVLPIAGSRELNSHEREYAVSRYKEKKKTRRYDKHIRYESRKARAETRTRINGRFAKTGH
ncbi:hypothetical protein OROGR_024897 [Orobanche gracilis]